MAWWMEESGRRIFTSTSIGDKVRVRVEVQEEIMMHWALAERSLVQSKWFKVF